MIIAKLSITAIPRGPILNLLSEEQKCEMKFNFDEIFALERNSPLFITRTDEGDCRVSRLSIIWKFQAVVVISVTQLDIEVVYPPPPLVSLPLLTHFVRTISFRIM